MERFFRYTQREQDLIDETRHLIDTRVYSHLKKKADFESGCLEHPSALRLTTGTIARAISLPAKERIAALTFTHKDVGQALKRLEALGLVDQLEPNGRYLRLRLPMVAVSTSERSQGQNQIVRSDAKNRGQIVRQIVRSENSETVEAQGFAEDGGVQIVRQIVRSDAENGVQIVRSENDESSETVEAQGFAGSNVVPLKIEKQSIIKSLPPISPQGGEETPSSSTHQNPNPNPNPNSPSIDGSQEEAEKTETEIGRLRTVVADAAKTCGGFIKCLDSEPSTEIIAGWVARGVKNWEVEEACEQVIANPNMKPFVNSIDTLLRQQAARTAKWKKSMCAG
ncbi:hypothetical protein [Serratia nevei]|uniref:hypothetical protein n=1 Tax=Serratia nevei TaxID=2703794 RepID=UPI00254E08F3|nr:hypothetical protein [Serratia nevei]MDK5224605.1 hypothetical protein [Serratia nevei]